ncbi:acylphosphatase [Halomonas denitrificans]|nr:acylphosphatase [Halomonas denitrificans]
MSCVKFRIEGRVQGVFFRASTQREAQRLGLTGHAINLADGSVEVLACGNDEALDALERWLHDGSPQARVECVEREPSDATPPEHFTTG